MRWSIGEGHPVCGRDERGLSLWPNNVSGCVVDARNWGDLHGPVRLGIGRCVTMYLAVDLS